MTRIDLRINLRVEFLSYWHAGSGAGQGAVLDAKVARDHSGLPYLPGRTLKGLFRDAFRLLVELGETDAAALEHLFGSASDGLSRHEKRPGALCFSNARLSAGFRALVRKAADRAALHRALFVPFASTALKDGIAKPHSLRIIELAVPLPLCASVDYRPSGGTTCPPSLSGASDVRALFELAAPLVREAGTHRRRGLGRVRITLEPAS